MGSVQEYKERKKNPWRAQLRNKRFLGDKPKVGWFASEALANEWIKQHELEWSRAAHNLPPTDDHLSKPVEQLIEEYRRRKTHKKASAPTENKVFDNFLSFRDFRTRQLRDFKNQDCWQWVEWLEDEYEWQGKPFVGKDGKVRHPHRDPKQLKPSTIRRAISVLRNAWSIAPRWHGFENLINPWLHPTPVKQSAIIKKRKRRLRKGELVRIIEACKGCDEHWRFYAPCAIYLAIDTGMRLQEVFNLDWDDIDFESRRITVQKSKTDYKKQTDGRTIVLPVMSSVYLQGVKAYSRTRRGAAAEGKVFPKTKTQFQTVWTDILMRAGIPFAFRDYKIPRSDRSVERDGVGLTIHDLRREASMRFIRALSKYQVAVMLGHASVDEEASVTDTYVPTDHEADSHELQDIQNKLDKYALGGLTKAEALKKGGMLGLVVEDGDMKVKVLKKAKPSSENVVPFKRNAAK